MTELQFWYSIKKYGYWALILAAVLESFHNYTGFKDVEFKKVTKREYLAELEKTRH